MEYNNKNTKIMCDKARMPKQPVYENNDWSRTRKMGVTTFPEKWKLNGEVVYYNWD